MLSIKLYRRMLRKVTKGEVMNICFWNQVGFMKEAEAVSGKRKKKPSATMKYVGRV